MKNVTQWYIPHDIIYKKIRNIQNSTTSWLWLWAINICKTQNSVWQIVSAYNRLYFLRWPQDFPVCMIFMQYDIYIPPTKTCGGVLGGKWICFLFFNLGEPMPMAEIVSCDFWRQIIKGNATSTCSPYNISSWNPATCCEKAQATWGSHLQLLLLMAIDEFLANSQHESLDLRVRRSLRGLQPQPPPDCNLTKELPRWAHHPTG